MLLSEQRLSALNLFCHLSEAVEVQGILLFQELDCDVAVGMKWEPSGMTSRFVLHFERCFCTDPPGRS